ncbi:MAG: cell division protein ZipA C-terminal FtsZ-binding domain-containing protein [Rhodocyclaceae bacterium]|nr:cell division protein ZipA C-terminal FtsZ-binding domain-containing protein [Rhodocyclaceae bacterium]
MSELQIALLGAGLVGVACVWAYNLWQEHQHKKVAEKIFKGGQPDALLGGQDEQPAADVRSEPSAAAPLGERIEPVASTVADDGNKADEYVESAAPPPTPPSEWADDIADCTLRVELADAVAAPALWAVQAAWAPQLNKPLTWLGYDRASAQWRRLTAHDAGHYADVAASLQLADRQGAVADSELAIFIDGVQRLAQQFSGAVEVPPRHEVIAHAGALDEFCASVDVQLGVSIVEATGGDFAGTKLRGLAEAAGLALKEDGRFHACDDEGRELFTLGNSGAELFDAESLRTLATHGVTFTLDVPRVADGTAVFDRMVAVARQMAQALGGTLVDGQRHMLSDPMIAGIRAKIGEVQQQMAKNRIPSGSQRALRLFS